MKSRSSLSSLKSSLYDTIDELSELATALSMNRQVSITEYLGMGVTLKSIIIQLRAIKEVLRQRKEAIPNGKIYSCFKFPTLMRIRMTESDLESLEEAIASFTEEYMKVGRTAQPELFSDKNRCLLKEEANNRISPEMAMVLFPSPTEDVRLNNKEQEPLWHESKAVNGKPGEVFLGKRNQGTKVTEDGEARA